MQELKAFPARDGADGHRFRLFAVGAVSAVFVAYYAAVLLLSPGEAYLRFHTSILFNVPALLALALAPIAVRRSRGRERAGWVCLAVMLVAWQIADWSYAYYAYVLHAEVPFPGLPDLAYYAGYAAFGVAIPLLAFPDHRLRDSRWLIDAGIVMIVAGVFGWEFIMRAMVDAGDATAFSVAVAIGYPLLDLGLLAALVVTFFASGHRLSKRAAVLAVSILVQVITDGLYSYTVNTGAYNELGDPIDLGWVAAYALIAFAFVLPTESRAPEAPVRQSILGFLAPYAALAPLAAVFIAHEGSPSAAFTAAAFAVVALVVIRQIATMRENLTLLHRVEAEGRSREALIQAQADLGEALFVVAGRRLLSANNATLALTGYNDGDLAALQSPFDIVPMAERGLLTTWLRERAEGTAQRTYHETAFVHRDGRLVYVEIAATRLKVEGHTQLLLAVRDITERKTYARQLASSKASLEEKSALLEEALSAEREHARHDALTGVLNHGAIAAELRAIVEGTSKTSTCAVIMLDIDGMKATNDMFGHQIGDRVLIEVSQAMSRPGASVGRYGGDEFIALLPGVSREDAQIYRDNIAAAVARIRVTDPVSGSRIPVEISIGIALFPEDASDVAGVLSLSDGEMYAEKRRRPVGDDAPVAPLRDERAARMIGDLVPLLTSPASLTEKLRQVAHRLSTGAGYDLVSLSLFDDPSARHVTYAAGVYSHRNGAPVPLIDSERPVIFNDLQNISGDDRWAALGDGGMQSAVVAPMASDGPPIGAITVACRRKDIFSAADAAFLWSVATQVAAIVRMSTLVDDLSAATASLEASRAETVMMLAVAAEAHDRTTGMHLRSIRVLAEALACELGYGEPEVAELGLAAVLHDIGKLSVPDAVLSSAGALDSESWELMKHHTIWGSQFLGSRRGFALAASVSRSHHERWDGGGYPDGLAGDAIPEAATIVTVADSFDAMRHDRPYRAGRGLESAIDEIRLCSGTQFNPRVVDALLRLHERGEVARLHHAADGEEGEIIAA